MPSAKQEAPSSGEAEREVPGSTPLGPASTTPRGLASLLLVGAGSPQAAEQAKAMIAKLWSRNTLHLQSQRARLLLHPGECSATSDDSDEWAMYFACGHGDLCGLGGTDQVWELCQSQQQRHQ